MDKSCRRVAPCAYASLRLCVSALYCLIHYLKQDAVMVAVDFQQAGIALCF
jgi:hypothetical protein